MSDNSHEILIRKNAEFVGVGHNSEIVQDAAGNDWIFYHGVNVRSPQGRCLLLDRVHWENDWPYVENQSPSSSYAAPVFK
jgi:arabinan endo-1,5-alpha-L-arabinosidase